MKRLLPAFALLVALAAAAVGAPPAPWDASLMRAPHERDGRFFVPWGDDPKSLWRVLRWQLFTRNPYDKSADPVVPRVENDGASLATALPDGAAAITWVGHATFAVEDGDDVFLTDPHFGKRALVPARHHPPGVPIESVPANAFAVLSHNHYDHLDAFTVKALPDTIGWYVPLGMADWFRKRERENVTELDWWQTVRRGRWKITCLPSQHWSRRIEQGMDRALWCSWLLDSGDYRYYFAGDTGSFPGFADFAREFGPIDVAMLPIGAYEPRWFMRYQHMDPAEAYQAFLDLGARLMFPMHWGTFDLTDEPIDEAPRVLKRVVTERGGDPERVRLLAVGERFPLPEGDLP